MKKFLGLLGLVALLTLLSVEFGNMLDQTINDIRISGEMIFDKVGEGIVNSGIAVSDAISWIGNLNGWIGAGLGMIALLILQNGLRLKRRLRTRYSRLSRLARRMKRVRKGMTKHSLIITGMMVIVIALIALIAWVGNARDEVNTFIGDIVMGVWNHAYAFVADHAEYFAWGSVISVALIIIAMVWRWKGMTAAVPLMVILGGMICAISFWTGGNNALPEMADEAVKTEMEQMKETIQVLQSTLMIFMTIALAFGARFVLKSSLRSRPSKDTVTNDKVVLEGTIV